MADSTSKPGGSTLLLDEYFAGSNEAFLPELWKLNDGRKLAGFVDRWKVDPRPWARAKIFEYLEQPLSTPGHNVVVKRLFKQAEKQKDTALMGAFLYVFDTLVRRQRRMKWHWDRATRQSWKEEELYAAKNNILPSGTMTVRNPKTGQPMQISKGGRVPKNGRLFSYRTRYYLRRRAWRYFRFLGYRVPAEFPGAVAGAFARYTDEDLAKGEHILDSWSLLNACFRTHPALTFTPSQVRLNEGRTLNELTPSPKLLKVWATAAGAEALWGLLPVAQSRFVRLWAIGLLKEHHQEYLAALTPAKLLPLFDSFDADTQQFASGLLEGLTGLESLPIETWLMLLETKDPSALAAICELMVTHVTAERLNLGQTIALTRAMAAPVAMLGLKFLKTRTIAAADNAVISDLAQARCEAVAPAITAFALSILGEIRRYNVTLVARFFDALLPPTRAAAWAWLTPESAGYDDPELWVRLLETPYEEGRLKLVKILEERSKIPGASIAALTPIWTAVLLGIHRGGRHKIKALHQISRALMEHADQAEALLPVMGLAIRSVRAAEARVGLAAVVQTIESNPALADAAAKAIPELRFVSAGATA